MIEIVRNNHNAENHVKMLFRSYCFVTLSCTWIWIKSLSASIILMYWNSMTCSKFDSPPSWTISNPMSKVTMKKIPVGIDSSTVERVIFVVFQGVIINCRIDTLDQLNSEIFSNVYFNSLGTSHSRTAARQVGCDHAEVVNRWDCPHQDVWTTSLVAVVVSVESDVMRVANCRADILASASKIVAAMPVLVVTGAWNINFIKSDSFERKNAYNEKRM